MISPSAKCTWGWGTPLRFRGGKGVVPGSELGKGVVPGSELKI